MTCKIEGDDDFTLWSTSIEYHFIRLLHDEN